ncbi:MAG: FHA domain-containing protein [Lachnospiraceae bacterium]|nr:FHA domain-containing protein [Lachnospiraceae bacterium]
MRTFYFKARNIGQEKYLTYTMGEETELDEDVLDYCEENDVKELVDIIYEEDDDYDYLTYDITNKVSLKDLMANEISSEQALFIVRNVAGNLISIKEQTIHLSYILLNREYVYVGDNNDVYFICVPVENKGSLSVEFKGFLRQLLANMKYNVDEDLSFVGKLLTYINGDNFNLRGLVGLTEALMEEAGIDHEEVGTIETDGVEVVNSEPVSVEADDNQEEKTESKVTDFMNDVDDEPLPEIGDDDADEEDEPVADDEELESILPAGMKVEENDNVIEDIDNISNTAKAVESVPVIENETDDAEDKAKEAESAEESASVLESENASEAASDTKTEPTEIPEIAVGDDILKKEDEEPKLEPISTPEDAPKPAPAKKEENLDVIKNKIKELVGDVPAAKTTDDPKKVKTLADLEEMIDTSKNQPPKKNVVKVNRAAIIQSIAEHEAETEELTEEELNKPKVEKAPEVEEKNNVETKPAEPAKTNTLLNAPKAMPYLIRVNTEERIMLNKATFKIGKASRGVDYSVSGNGAVSRQHAVIIQKDGVCYIKDNKSTNHTYVNDKEVEEGKEEILTHDSTIKLGDEEFLFKIR